MGAHASRVQLISDLKAKRKSLEAEGHGSEVVRAHLKQDLMARGYTKNTINDYLRCVFLA